MKTREMLLVVAVLTLFGCSSHPSAAAVCKKLEAVGIAKSCKASAPAAINARASEEAVFDLVGVSGKTGHVLAFAKQDDFDATVKAYEAAAFLAGSHRYGSQRALVFVQLNSDADVETGRKAKAVVDGL